MGQRRNHINWKTPMDKEENTAYKNYATQLEQYVEGPMQSQNFFQESKPKINELSVLNKKKKNRINPKKAEVR